MEEEKKVREMHELEKIIEFEFKDINNLAKAMYAKRIHTEHEGKNHKEWTNDVLATIGDAFLKAILADKLYSDDNTITKGVVTDQKMVLENNNVLYKIANETGITQYAYHDTKFLKDGPSQEEQVSNSSHNQYIEAIIYAIYIDSGFDRLKDWVMRWLYPKLKEVNIV